MIGRGTSNEIRPSFRPLVAARQRVGDCDHRQRGHRHSLLDRSARARESVGPKLCSTGAGTSGGARVEAAESRAASDWRHVMNDPAARLLIVDDEVREVTALMQALAKHGYAVTGAHSADEALRLLRSESFDLLLTDLMM